MVRGLLHFENPGAVAAGQRIEISIQDTSRIGASSVDVATKTVTIPEDFDAENDALPFEIEISMEMKGLTVRAHMPCHEGPDVRVGDMVTTASIPLSDDDDAEINVKLRRV